jgi:TusA-related sulfurtransferase
MKNSAIFEGTKNVKLDCKNRMCPVPLVELSKAMKKMEIGQIFEMEVTDPAFTRDLQAWIRRTGNELISLDIGDPIRVVIRKQ